MAQSAHSVVTSHLGRGQIMTREIVTRLLALPRKESTVLFNTPLSPQHEKIKGLDARVSDLITRESTLSCELREEQTAHGAAVAQYEDRVRGYEVCSLMLCASIFRFDRESVGF